MTSFSETNDGPMSNSKGVTELGVGKARMNEEKKLLECVEITGRGRALVSTQQLLAGQILLQEAPSLVYVDSEGALIFCGTCLRSCPSAVPCSGCQVATFCSPTCSAAHSSHLCQALSHMATKGFDPECENQARFLLAAYHSSLFSPAEFGRLMLLEGEGKVKENVRKVHAFVDSAVREWPWKGKKIVKEELTADLLVKDARNAYGHMAPSETLGQRAVRGFAIYPTASLINHDCLPNSCRFDYIDGQDDSNTDIFIRALHDIPKDVEVTMSYFPINWSYPERQRRLAEDYGFKCVCERCSVEQNWSYSEDDDSDGGSSTDAEVPNEGVDSTSGKLGDLDGLSAFSIDDEETENDDDFDHAMFFVKYLCPREECGGTMAPLPPSNSVDDAAIHVSGIEKDLLLPMECNMCGKVRTSDEFYKDLQEHRMLS